MSTDYDNASIGDLIDDFVIQEITFNEVIKINKNKIEKLIFECAKRIRNKNKIFFVGSGTSGRLGMIESAEIYPTFGDKTYIGIIAGGESAMTKSIEGSEDSLNEGIDQLNLHKLNSEDLIIGISTSGTTPFTIATLNKCKSKKIKTCLISNKSQNDYDINIQLGVQKEKILGSTRMLSGTLTKQLLNMITTISMIKSGKTYKNYMVNVKPLNKKLIKRSIDIISKITNTNEKDAEILFKKSNYQIKHAIVMNVKKLDYENAKKLLKDNDGFLNKII
ncbi:MAG: N-acetylmuramic acid 6-phosphate etherase [Chloroflexi bacterium]|nr:N-acetylmuramic acid 6-phosphate etherase [Chloroflexota bacterium]